ncbi:MAG: glycine--tRNA ligase subunit beta [Elusimicrobiaceae bacterium]|nr:glycine--tRNA ligase subunit beta [Elusimicrobiaceae bacterium]
MNALLQIGTEHLPARFLRPALEQLKENAIKILAENRLNYKTLETYGTYKKLVLEIKDLAEVSEDISKEVKGPPAKLLKGADGKFTPQALGFAAKNGIKAEQLVVKETDKGPFIYADIKIKGIKTEKLLTTIFPELIKSLNFAKNMVWEDSGFRFARPIRSIIALYGSKIIKFEIAGVKSSNKAYGLSSFKQTPIIIKNPESYKDALKNQIHPILVDIEERKKALLRSIEGCTKLLGYQADLDEDLISETVNFTEHPIALAGDMALSFMKLPKKLLTTVLKTQIKMFPVVNKKGELQPHFIAVRDGVSVNQEEVKTGFKNVMTARLTDAVFFFENDLKLGLDEMRKKLKNINFIDGMGTMEDKTKRITDLTNSIAKLLNFSNADTENAKTAANYAYADLASSVVYEFTDLQGYMGGVYAQKEGRTPDVCAALEEFYLPLSASSDLPKTKVGSLVSLAGKLDTLAANFKAGQVPSGSQDPFALRRQAMGAVRIILANHWSLSINKLVELASKNLPENTNNQLTQLPEFLWQRLQNILEDRLIPEDIISAVKNFDTPLNTVLLNAGILAEQLKSETLQAVAESARRVANILKQAPQNLPALNAALLKEQEEIALNKAVDNLPKADGDFTTELKNLSTLKQPLEDFFAKIMVNAKEAEIKNNRLALLSKIKAVLFNTADLGKLKKRG